MIRISVKSGASQEKVAEAVQIDLAADKGSPTRLMAEKLTKALQDEEWRGIDRISQLSAIEFRKLNLDRVKAFAEQEKPGKDVADKLVTLAEQEWDRLAKTAEAKEGNQPPHRTDWKGRCEQFANVVVAQAMKLLAADQLDRLRQALMCRFGG